MDTILQAALLGVVEGLTEFLPVSSTGHLILLIDLLDFEGPKGKIFEIVIQLGAILAICWLYRARLFGAVANAASDPESFRFLRNIFLAFLPAALLGAVFHGFIKTVLFSPWVVSSTLILGGFAIIAIERWRHQPRFFRPEDFSGSLALKIGLCQAVAMIPGVSRSGATIMGGLLLGVERRTATEFSFFLAIPTMLGATVFDIYKNWHSLDGDGVAVILVGFVTAFIAALLIVRWAIAFITRHGFIPFAIYRIFIGTGMLGLLIWQS